MRKFTAKQTRFVDEYLIDLNATKAAIRAGYSARVVDELRKIAFANMSDYMKPTPDGYPYLDFSGLTRDQTAALAEVTVDAYSEGAGDDAREVKRVKFKLHDKLGALDKLGRHLGLFVFDKHHDVKIKVDIADVQDTVLRALARLADARRAAGGHPVDDRRTITEVPTRVELVGE